MKLNNRFYKGKISLTTLLAFGIFSTGMILSLLSSWVVARLFIYAMLIAGLVGVGFLCFGPLAKQRIFFHEKSTQSRNIFILTHGKSLLLLIIVQVMFLFLSWCFFYIFEHQTGLTGRLHVLAPGTLITLLIQHPWTLGFAPWLLYAVFGVGLAYLSICMERTPTLPTVLFKEYNKHPAAFFHYYAQVVVDTTTQMPFVLLLILTLLWSVETINVTFNWPSLFEYPWRTFLSFTLISLLFRKSNTKLLDWTINRRQPLSSFLCIYVLGFATLLFWMHSTGSYFTFGSEVTDPNLVLKSPLAGAFSNATLENRLQLLIWGWWGLWMPSLAAVIGRLSLGLKVYEACLNAIFVPALVFLGLMSYVDAEFFKGLFPSVLPMPLHWFIFVFLLICILLIYGKVYTTADIQRGAMPSLALPLRAWLFKRWITSALFIFMCTMMAVIMLGWLPLQVIGTFGTGFMLTVFFIFLFALFSSKGHFSAEEKCKVPSES